MRRCFPLALSLLVLGGGAPARADQGNAPPLGPQPKLELDATAKKNLAQHRSWLAARPRALATMPALVPVPLVAQGDLEVESAKTSLSFDTSQGEFTASTELVITALSPTSDVSLYFYDLLSGATKVSDAQGELSTYASPYGVTNVSLRAPLAVGESLTLTVDQSGTPQCKSQFLSLVTCMVSPSMTFSMGAWQPAVYDFTAGRLLGPKSASLEVVVADTLTVGATGIAGQVTTNPDGTKSYTFTNDYNGGLSFGAAPYVTDTLPFGSGKTAGTFLLPGNASLGGEWRKATADVMTFHAARYGPYDPPRIDVVEMPDVVGAAYGPLLAIFMPSTSLSYPPTHWSGTMTLAHELAHQWFGGMIDNQDQLSPWLNEGFAEFAQMEYTASLASPEYGYDFGPYLRQRKNASYVYTVKLSGVDVPISSNLLYQAPPELYVAVIYDKGPLVVSMLRYLLGGDSPFFAAVQAYRNDHEGTGADIDSFKASLKQATGVDLTQFLAAWIYDSGYPTYKVDVKRASSGATITVAADKDYAVPVELEIVTADGKTETVRVSPSASDPTTFEHVAQSSSEVLAVRFDPEKQIPGRALGQLPGDLHLNGEVDGTDLVYAAFAYGQSYDPYQYGWTDFADWADLVLDGSVNQQDLDVVLKSFGKRTGE